MASNGEPPKEEFDAIWRLNYGPKNVNNKIMHIRAIVDDWVVFRVWSRRLRWWRYGIEPLSEWRLAAQNGHLRRVRRGPIEIDLSEVDNGK